MPSELPAPTAITNLLFRYAELIDAGDYEGIGELLTHCTVTSDQGGEWTAPRRSRACITTSPASTGRYPAHQTRHHQPDRRGRRRYGHLPGVLHGLHEPPTLPLQPIVNGRYRDTFERVDGVWRYKHRVMIVEHVGDVSDT